MIRSAAFALLILVAACSGGDDVPGGVTADEASQLNDAAAMLDNDSVALNQLTRQDPP